MPQPNREPIFMTLCQRNQGSVYLWARFLSFSLRIILTWLASDDLAYHEPQFPAAGVYLEPNFAKVVLEPSV